MLLKFENLKITLELCASQVRIFGEMLYSHFYLFLFLTFIQHLVIIAILLGVVLRIQA